MSHNGPLTSHYPSLLCIFAFDFFLGDWRKKPQTVWKKTSVLTQRKVIQICYTEVKESSWEFLLRKPLNIIVPNHQESKYDISYLIFFSRSPLQAGYIIKIFSLWNRFFSETRTLVNSLDTFFYTLSLCIFCSRWRLYFCNFLFRTA